VPPLLIFLVEKFANINPVISGWSFSLRKKVSCKHIMSGICFCQVYVLINGEALLTVGYANFSHLTIVFIAKYLFTGRVKILN
jgi:hypothetical protein